MGAQATRIEFSPEFDAGFYIASNKLDGMSEEDARKHFEAVGKAHGIAGARFASEAWLCKYLEENFRYGRALEIGPGHNPKLRGEHIAYFDVFDSARLRENARRYGIDASRVPKKIDYISENGDLRTIPEKFDLIFSSHQIEHSTDLIKYLNDIASLLKPEGILALIVPDKRYTFDYFRDTTMEDVLAQHLGEQHPKGHSIKPWLEHHLRMTHNDPVRHWQGDHGKPLQKLEDIRAYIEAYNAINGYVDIHRWIFTDDSFRGIIRQLIETGFIAFRDVKVYNTLKNTLQFTAICQTGAQP